GEEESTGSTAKYNNLEFTRDNQRRKHGESTAAARWLG
ncbi:hypothetical protein A2U01_0056831, partial [Trifolium medium]|nr:hypothetical protein [Trifolium medium]